MRNEINGYPVIASFEVPKKHGMTLHRIVLVDRGRGEPEKYVTANQEIGQDSWYWGHYFDDFKEAFEDFVKRARSSF